MILNATNISKSFGSNEIIKDATFLVNEHEKVAIVGVNGAGKTTTFYMIVGIIRPDEGDVTADGKSLDHMPIHERHQFGISYLPQEASIFRKMTVWENMMSLLETRTELSPAERKEKAEGLLEEFHITHVKNTRGDALSGGERRRAEIARSLTMGPSFILLDEPFAGVDPLAVEDMQSVVMHLKTRGIGILITDHNVRETLRIVDNAYILSEGKILLNGKSGDIAADPVARKFYLGENFSL